MHVVATLDPGELCVCVLNDSRGEVSLAVAIGRTPGVRRGTEPSQASQLGCRQGVPVPGGWGSQERGEGPEQVGETNPGCPRRAANTPMLGPVQGFGQDGRRVLGREEGGGDHFTV